MENAQLGQALHLPGKFFTGTASGDRTYSAEG